MAASSCNSWWPHVVLLYGLVAVLFTSLLGNIYWTYRISTAVGALEGSVPSYRTDRTDVPGSGGRRKLASVGETESEEDPDSVSTRWKRRRHPRQYHEDNGVPSVEVFPNPQPTVETKGFVWLTAYSRIPVPVLEDFCSSTKRFCPAGDPGPPGSDGIPGDKGIKGDRGDRGFPGPPGLVGPHGPPGPGGPIGPRGEHGRPGLDGRDGLPGVPGLDGVPGRDGVDGISGRDGIPGIPGTPGKFGTNGTNGIPGSPGPRGPLGPPGPPGLAGPRGRKGMAGKAGTPGIPGINAWRINGTEANKILVPPSIVDTDEPTTIVVQEGENVKLRCSATGVPNPEVVWRQEENNAIQLGSWSMSTVQGDTLSISPVGRDHMGNYLCIASNGIPPPAIKTVRLEVTFPPLIQIKNQMVGTVNGSYAVLECFVQASPPPLHYWLHGDGRLIEPSFKMKLIQTDEGYRTHLILNITNIEPADYGLYKCGSRNEKGKTQGVFTVFEIDPTIPTRKPPKEPNFVVYGQVPPPRAIEPECPQCADCPLQQKCPSGGKAFIQNVVTETSFDTTGWLPLDPRVKDCLLTQVGKPVFYRYTKADQGAWMQDSKPRSPSDEEKYWVTVIDDNAHLYEYSNKNAFRAGQPMTKHLLVYAFVGNSQIVYNGSFYYQQAETDKLLRYELASQGTAAVTVPGLAFKHDQYLYAGGRRNFMDLAVDENGLWAIYANNASSYTIVLKFDPYTLQTQAMWNLSLTHQNVGEMFIACGVLYALESVSERTTHIGFAYDLYEHEVKDVSVEFTNPFRQTSYVAYNPRLEQIFTWDGGNQLVYPVRFSGYDTEDDPGTKR